MIENWIPIFASFDGAAADLLFGIVVFFVGILSMLKIDV